MSLGIATVSTIAMATPPIEIAPITPENAKELGFTVQFAVEGERTSIDLVGPKSINEKCWPERSGSYLISETGEDRMFSMHKLGDNVVPAVYSVYPNRSSENLAVFIDYLCPSNPQDGRRYTIESAAEYLRQTQQPIAR